MKERNDIWFVYDGECPICQMGASFYKVQQSVGELHTIDARTEKQHPVILEINKARLDLDEGMVIKYKGKLNLPRFSGHNPVGSKGSNCIRAMMLWPLWLNWGQTAACLTKSTIRFFNPRPSLPFCIPS